MNCAGCIATVLLSTYCAGILLVWSFSDLYAAAVFLVFGSPLLLASLLMAVAAQAGDPPNHKRKELR